MLIANVKAGALLMHDGTQLPAALEIEREIYSKSWRLVKNWDLPAFSRYVDKAGWHFMFIAGQVTSCAFGMGGARGVQRAIGRICSKVRSLRFNCLGVDDIVRHHFLGIPYITVVAHSYQLQQGNTLEGPKPVTPIKDYYRV